MPGFKSLFSRGRSGPDPSVSPEWSGRLDTSSVHQAQLEDLVRQGKTIEAIKLYRQDTGASLREAKDAVDRIRLGMGR